MKIPAKPENEQSRLQALERLNVLDTQRDAVLDGITRAIADFCEVPIALISLIDADRQWFKSSTGLVVHEAPRDRAFCAHAILESDELMEVPDATLDQRFYDHPLVNDEPHIRFYAGMPLVTSGGFALGTLCVIDTKPRVLSLPQRQTLERLSRTIVALIERMQHDSVSIVEQIIMGAVHHGIVITDPNLADNPVIYCNHAVEKMTGYRAAEIIGRNCRIWQGADTDPAVVEKLRDALTLGECCTVTLKNYKRNRTEFWNELTVAPVRNLAGYVTHYVGVQQDVTDKLNALDKAAQLGAVLEESLNEIYICDHQSLQFVHVNRCGRENLGYGMDELQAFTPLDIAPDMSKETLDVLINQLRDEGHDKTALTTFLQRKDGSRYSVELHVQRACFDSKPVFLAVALDVSERQLAMQQLKESNALLEQRVRERTAALAAANKMLRESAASTTN